MTHPNRVSTPNKRVVSTNEMTHLVRPEYAKRKNSPAIMVLITPEMLVLLFNPFVITSAEKAVG
uniref:hypothetical protein n=1 Tax=Roseivirga sp. TaxID=1964215 RepID=UPI0040474C3A